MSLGIMIARQRCGTGALGSVLDQHPAIRYLGEVFHHDAVDQLPNYFCFFRELVGRDPDVALPQNSGKRFDLYREYVETYAGRANTILDIKYSSLHHFNAHWMGINDAPGLFKVLRDRELPVIHLQRRNHLKTYVSGQLAELNREWHARSTEAVTVRSVEIDPEACIRSINAQTREVTRIERILGAHTNLISLEYADLFDSSGELRHSACVKLAAFFAVEDFVRKRPAFIKQAPDDLREALLNYRELASALNDTPHAWMLRADRPEHDPTRVRSAAAYAAAGGWPGL